MTQSPYPNIFEAIIRNLMKFTRVDSKIKKMFNKYDIKRYKTVLLKQVLLKQNRLKIKLKN